MLDKITQSGLRWIWLTVILLILDQWTKLWAQDALSFGRIIEVLPHFDLRYAENRGAAFSFLADAGGWQRWGLSIFTAIVSVVLVVWLSRLQKHERWLAIALSLVLSGAIGNLIDRVSYGYVIDFIDWYVSKDGYHWPTFNIADTAISIGAVMLIIESLFFPQEEKQGEDKASKTKQSEAKTKS